MNLRRIVMASGSRLWKRAVPFPASAGVWNRAYTMMAAPTAATDGIKASASTPANVASSMKRKMCVKLKNLSETGEKVAEKLNEFTKEEGLCVTQKYLIRWAKLLDKYGNHQHALEIFEWMEKNHMSFSTSQHVIFLDLVAKTNGMDAAIAYFERLDPNFADNDYSAKYSPVYQKLFTWYYQPKGFSLFRPLGYKTGAETEDLCN